MSPEQFVDAIREVVRDAAVEGVINNLVSPPGRKVSTEERKRSTWYSSLGNDDRSYVNDIISSAVDEAVFGMLSVIDGARAIEEGGEKGELVLMYKSDEREVLLKDNKGLFLHDMYNSLTQ